MVHKLPPGVTLRGEKNGVILARSFRLVLERPDHPGLAALRDREKLEAVVAPGADEWAKQRLLCSWVNNQFAMGTPSPYPIWDANVVLTEIRSGRTGGYCAQYAVVLVQAAEALGWPARYLDLKPADPKASGHVTVEVWSNQYERWLLLDPTFDAVYQSEGLPLSALDVHQALVQGKADQVQLVHGTGAHGLANTPAEPVLPFHGLAVDMRADHLSRPAHFWDRGDGYLAWRDAATDGSPRVYSAFAENPVEFNFPLNQVQARINGFKAAGVLFLQLRTNMSFPAAFERATREGKWVRHNSPFTPAGDPDLRITFSGKHGAVIAYDWKLMPGDNRIWLRAVDVRGNAGPATMLWVSYDPKVAQPTIAAGSTEE